MDRMHKGVATRVTPRGATSFGYVVRSVGPLLLTLPREVGSMPSVPAASCQRTCNTGPHRCQHARSRSLGGLAGAGRVKFGSQENRRACSIVGDDNIERCSSSHRRHIEARRSLRSPGPTSLCFTSNNDGGDMDQTPRLRSAYPATPQTSRRPPRVNSASPRENKRSNAPIPSLPALKPTSHPPNDPLIPERILDAPTQRLFAFSAAVALWTWRIYDWGTLHESDEQSLWLFMKWVAIDGIFLFGLPGLRIPWLEWSASTMMLLFSSHALLDAMLMFRVPLPIAPAFAALARSMWGAYELAVNEHNVNPATVKFNDSLILGRQVINILPEGWAVLNPDKHAFCLDALRTEARLPIKINSTNPISMELLRTDLDTEANETIHIGKSQIKTMHKEALRLTSYSEKDFEPKTIYFSVKRPGLYLLSKVVDDSNLEVSRKHLAHTVVVPCPRAEVRPSSPDQCRGDLSTVEIDVIGTPPLTLKYRKSANGVPHMATLENLMPAEDDFFSPLARQDQSALIVPNKVDTAWARTRKIPVPLSESLSVAGRWTYSVEEVRDAFGNVLVYSRKDHEEQERHSTKSSHLHQTIMVHERPTVKLEGCNSQKPLKVAKGKKAILPLQLGSGGKYVLNETYDIDYVFVPESEPSLSQASAPRHLTFRGVNSKSSQEIRNPGLYTLTDVSTEFCKGEVLEPASCVLQNPPQPHLSLSQEEIFDKCAGSPIGLRVDLDLVGTPPFNILYRMIKLGDKIEINQVEKIEGLRGQIELTPTTAGKYRYDFVEISDAVYKAQKLTGLSIDQDVKPSASAGFVDGRETKVACIDETVSFNVGLRGEGPFSLEYEVVHNGRRSKHDLAEVQQNRIAITTEPLTEGGDYTVALVSVTDRMGCKEFLKDERRVSVRHQKPRAGFRAMDGLRSISALEEKAVELPLRLEGGEGLWIVQYVDKSGHNHTVSIQQGRDSITVSDDGIYELTSVRDGMCPGAVDEPTKSFEVQWIPRPELRFASTDIVEHSSNTLRRADVCEGDEDAVDVLFKGSPPYTADYQLHVQPTKGSMSPKNKELRAAQNVASLRMDTKLAGAYEYKFHKLSDARYSHSSKHFTPLTVQQRVHPRPSVAFANPEKTYRFCSSESEGEEVIPITLHGIPPFDVELEIKHHGTARPETVSLTGITGLTHDLRIPRARLQRGKSAISLRRVSDNRGCVRALDSTTPRVQISVHDAPSISPLESQADFCVGDRINFALSGIAPFNVFYNFEGAARKAVATSSTFRRLAEKPGTFVVTGVQDDASQCRAATNITKHIHSLPSVRVSKGRDSYIDIHEGGEAEILFEFGGTPPFEFTYTRSSNTDKNGKKPGRLLDMRSERSESHSRRIRAHEEGTYEVVSIKDRYCAYSKPGVKFDPKGAQKRLTL